MAQRVVNVVPNVAGQGVREILEQEAQARGMKFRPFVGWIYKYAVGNKDAFGGRLKEARPKDGKHIGAVTDAATADALKAWAKERVSSRGLLCNFILEWVIEKDLFQDIFGK
jgi:hypothetical protein